MCPCVLLPDRLDNFDGPAVAEKAIEQGLHEEAFEIYKKFKMQQEAIKVLLHQMEQLDRAYEFAAKIDEPPVWTELGDAQLTHAKVPEAIASYLQANEHSKWSQVRRSSAGLGQGWGTAIAVLRCCRGAACPCTHPTTPSFITLSDVRPAYCSRRAHCVMHRRQGYQGVLLPRALRHNPSNYRSPSNYTTPQCAPSTPCPSTIPTLTQPSRSCTLPHPFSLQVIDKARDAACWNDLVTFLQMVRKRVKEPKVDGELVYAWAKLNNLAALGDFISNPNMANLQNVGDRLFEVGAATRSGSQQQNLGQGSFSCICRIAPATRYVVRVEMLAWFAALLSFVPGAKSPFTRPRLPESALRSCPRPQEKFYEAARLLFAHIPNWGRLASTLVKLHRFQDAVDAARKANSPKTWKEVCFACIDEKETRLAQLCGLNIIVNAGACGAGTSGQGHSGAVLHAKPSIWIFDAVSAPGCKHQLAMKSFEVTGPSDERLVPM